MEHPISCLSVAVSHLFHLCRPNVTKYLSVAPLLTAYWVSHPGSFLYKPTLVSTHSVAQWPRFTFYSFSNYQSMNNQISQVLQSGVVLNPCSAEASEAINTCRSREGLSVLHWTFPYVLHWASPKIRLLEPKPLCLRLWLHLSSGLLERFSSRSQFKWGLEGDPNPPNWSLCERGNLKTQTLRHFNRNFSKTLEKTARRHPLQARREERGLRPAHTLVLNFQLQNCKQISFCPLCYLVCGIML